MTARIKQQMQGEHMTATANARIRIASPDDATAIRAVYEPYVLNTAITFEDEVPTVEEFARRITRTLQSYPYYVAELDGEVVAYCYAGILKERSAYQHAAETSIYVSTSMRGGGLGTRLYALLENTLEAQNVTCAYACISASTPPCPEAPATSQAFHEHLGYRLIGTFEQCGYKFDRWFDMVWMEKKLVAEPATPYPAFVPFSQLERSTIDALLAKA